MTIVTTLFILSVHLLGLAMALHSVMSTRSTQGTIAWMFSLVTFPYVAVPAYLFLGRNKFDGYVSARQASSEKFDPLIELIAKDIEPQISKAGHHDSDIWLCKDLCRIPVLNNNQVELLIDGQQTFNHLLAGIERAEHYVLFQFFIVKNDQLGQRVRDALVRCAKRGVSVYFLYDEIGSHALSADYIQSLRDAKITVASFNASNNFKKRYQINFRNHRKNVVVDGIQAWVGGHNVGDEYLGKSKRFGHWRDTHMSIIGPATKALQLTFLEDWNWATENVLELNWSTQTSHLGEVPVLIVPSGPADELETAKLMIIQALNSAKQRIWITSPYFVPDEAVISALHLAALRGIDVRIIIPNKPDHYFVYLTGFAYVEQVMRPNIKFYRYSNGFLHQKVMLIDDIYSAIGTANMDNRSFRLNFEVTALIESSSFALQVEQMLLTDIENSKLVMSDELSSRPWYFRLMVRVARLSAPVL